ncbi:MAG: hypothetical protein WC763_07125 [Candidatus Paceibacterota bacterium]|jgi:hypothetical protein
MTPDERKGLEDIVRILNEGRIPSVRRWDEWGKAILAADAELKRLRESSKIVLMAGDVTTYAAEPCPSCEPLFNENKRLREAVLWALENGDEINVFGAGGGSTWKAELRRRASHD